VKVPLTEFEGLNFERRERFLCDGVYYIVYDNYNG